MCMSGLHELKEYIINHAIMIKVATLYKLQPLQT